MSTSTVRVLPAPTWNWLKVNDITIENIETIGSLDSIEFKDGETIKLPMTYDVSARNCVDVKAPKDTKGTLILDHKSAGNGIVGGLTLNFDLKAGSDITIVQVVRMDDADSLISGFVGSQDADSRLKVVQVFLGGKNVYVNLINDLTGDGSYFDLKSAYKLHSGNMLDINYVINHFGKRTECNLDSKGVLYKGAEKTYRGTIDFKKGCKGSVGNEIEDVLLMDDDVVNKTVPIILCAEEDVEGNHGATIGRVAEDIMFYMKSRGVSEEEITKMLADARIEAVVRHIPDEGLRDEINGNQ